MSGNSAEGPPNPGRRALLLGVAALAADQVLAHITKQPSLLQKGLENIGKIQDGQPENDNLPEKPAIVKKEHLDINDVNHINNLALDSPQRPAAEKKFVDQAKTLEEVDLGLNCVVDLQRRIQLFEKRYKLRLDGHPKLRQLTKEELDLARDYKIHPETLAVCTDYRNRAKIRIDQKLKDDRPGFLEKFRPDLISLVKTGRLPQEMLDTITAEDMLINPLAMAKILIQETGSTKGGTDDEPSFGGVRIGTWPSINLLRNGDKPEEAEDAKQGLIALTDDLNILNKKPGAAIPNLSYVVGNIPGAPQVIDDPKDKISGGDMGIVQFRPNTAWAAHQMLKTIFNIYLNPLGLDAIEAAYLFIASGAIIDIVENGEITGKDLKFGYINTDSELDKIPHEEGLLGKMERGSFDKWNSSYKEAILEWKRIYRDRIIEPGIYQSMIAPAYQKKAA